MSLAARRSSCVGWTLEGPGSQISHLTESPSNLAWAPDGATLAFNMNVPERPDPEWRIPMPAPPKGAKWVEPPKIVTRLNFRSDRVGYTDTYYRQIFVIPADGGEARQLTTGDWNASPPAFSGDGQWVAFSSLRVPDAEHVFRRSEIYAANVASGEIRMLTHASGTSGGPVYSPDGRLVAYMHADSVDHSAWSEGNVWVMNADGSNPRSLTANLDRPVSGILWAPNGAGVYFNVQSEGSQNLYFASTAGQVRPVTIGTQVLAVTDLARNGLAVGTRTTPTMPNDVVTFTIPASGTVSTFAQRTNVDASILAGKKLASTEEIWYTSKDGLKIQGWIVKPPDFDPHQKYPLILQIHGGPQAMYNVAFNFARQDDAARDYVVLYTNPRGSTGYGAKFTNLIDNEYPDKDFDDLMAGVDTVIGRGYVDTNNLFVYGCSGGGVLTAWTVGHTDRFAAAVVAVPRDRLDQFRGRDRRRGLVRELRQALLGRSERVSPALAHHVRGARQDADHAHDRRARPAHADPADGGVLPRAEAARRAHRHDAHEQRVPRHVEHAVELSAHAALYRALVRALRAHGQVAGGHGDDAPALSAVRAGSRRRSGIPGRRRFGLRSPASGRLHCEDSSHERWPPARQLPPRRAHTFRMTGGAWRAPRAPLRPDRPRTIGA